MNTQVGEYDEDALANGFTFVYAPENPDEDEDLSEDEIQVYNTDSPTEAPNSPTVQAELTIPLSLGKAVQEECSNTRISFVIYRTPVLFPSRSLIEYSEGEPNFNRSANTRIISASVHCDAFNSSKLSEPIRMTYIPIVKANPKKVKRYIVIAVISNVASYVTIKPAFKRT